MSSIPSTYGANIAFIEELYEKYRSDPNSVSTSWREFFHDFQPEEEEEQKLSVASGASPAAERPRAAAPAPAPVPPTPRPVAVAPNATPLRGAAGKIAMDPLGSEGFDVRQPQHIALAGALGMGEFELKSSPRGRRHVVKHEIIEI